MPSGAITKFMFNMTQLGKTPQEIESEFVQFQSILVNLLIAFAIIFGLTLLTVKIKSKIQNKL